MGFTVHNGIQWKWYIGNAVFIREETKLGNAVFIREETKLSRNTHFQSETSLLLTPLTSPSIKRTTPLTARGPEFDSPATTEIFFTFFLRFYLDPFNWERFNLVLRKGQNLIIVCKVAKSKLYWLQKILSNKCNWRIYRSADVHKCRNRRLQFQWVCYVPWIGLGRSFSPTQC